MERFCKLKELYRLIYDIEASLQQQFGLSVNECMVLCSINMGQNTFGQMAENLSQSKSRMSKILTELEKKQLIERNHADSDKRRMIFSLTSKGQSKLIEVENRDFNIPEIDIKFQ
jgi:DNA-binding MarR family transcriptional regulator